MASGELALRNHHYNFGRKRQKAQRICNCGARFADALCQLVLRQLIVGHELLHRRGGFYRVEILALQVLDKGNLLYLPLVVAPDNYRDRRIAGKFRRPEAALARNYHVGAVVVVVHDDGHYHAVLLYRIGKLFKRLLVEVLSRLIGVCLYFVERHILRILALLFGVFKRLSAFVYMLKSLVCVLEQRLEPLT